ncbi:TIGR03084 family metal-binding protein [Streptomyces klenkii]|uniref:TIGR03084 family metal-binding protein n=1 Tax=Streptomyces klenkii TaxID=1420899 RepID=UPI00344946C3
MRQQRDVLADLSEEGFAVDELVAGLNSEGWATPTPAEGWTVRHQLAHLTMVFGLAERAAADPSGFDAFLKELPPSFAEAVDAGMKPHLAKEPGRLLDGWRTQRAATERALFAIPPGQVVPWLVRPIPAKVLAQAGMTELFGHGQDIADGLGVGRTYTDRVLHVAEFTALTWEFGYQARGIAVPGQGFRFELTAPSGEPWRFGDPRAEQCVSGPAVDLCLLATRRRHRGDLALVASGPDADRWLDIAQAYRGPAGTGRRPGQFAAPAH